MIFLAIFPWKKRSEHSILQQLTNILVPLILAFRLACADLTLQVMKTSPKICQVTKVYGFITTSIRPTKNKFCKMVDQNTQIMPLIYNDVITTRTLDQLLLFYLYIYKTCNNETLQEVKCKHALILPFTLFYIWSTFVTLSPFLYNL